MSVKKNLHLFTISFPLGDGELFLQNEITYLSKAFDTIYIFPLECLNEDIKYTLPPNVKVIRFNIFQPYNRVKIILKNIRLIGTIYLTEFTRNKNRLKYFRRFSKTLSELTHKIAIADKLQDNFKNSSEKIIAYTYWFNQWTFILSLLNKKYRKIDLFTRVHGMDVYEEQHAQPGFFFSFRTFQLKQIKKVLAISENGSNHLIAANDLHSDKIILSRLGVEDNGLSKNEKLSFFRIVSCSALQPYKRIDLIIDILKNTTSRIEWVHFGDGELKDFFLQKTKELPANVSLTWMGNQSNNTVLNYYKNNHVDLFINVSQSEGIPVSIMEATSFGIPVIATEVGGVPEIVNEKTGFLIAKDFQPLQVSALLERIIKNDSSLVKSRNAVNRFWRENFFAETNYKKLIDILKN